MKSGEKRTVVQKSCFPYEWFNVREKLNYPGLPDYPAWYSRLKGECLDSYQNFKSARKYSKKRACKLLFAYWLCYYNNRDVVPGLEALEKMRAFYTDKGIDILKDAVSLPGVSFTLYYLWRGLILGGAELYSPCREAYGMLKEAVVGRPRLVPRS